MNNSKINVTRTKCIIMKPAAANSIIQQFFPEIEIKLICSCGLIKLKLPELPELIECSLVS